MTARRTSTFREDLAAQALDFREPDALEAAFIAASERSRPDVPRSARDAWRAIDAAWALDAFGQ